MCEYNDADMVVDYDDPKLSDEANDMIYQANKTVEVMAEDPTSLSEVKDWRDALVDDIVDSELRGDTLHYEPFTSEKLYNVTGLDITEKDGEYIYD